MTERDRQTDRDRDRDPEREREHHLLAHAVQILCVCTVRGRVVLKRFS